MNKYLAEKGKELTTDEIGRIIQRFETSDLPILNKRYNYYMGKHKILLKKPSDAGKPCNKIVCNYVENIISTYEGYALGVPVTYSNDDTNFEAMQEVLDYNDVADTDGELYRLGLIFGRAAEICYIDEEAKIRFKTLDPRQIIPIYDNTLSQELMAAVRYYKEDLVDERNTNYIVELYTNTHIIKYRSVPGFTSFTELSREPHHFNQCPVTFFSLNAEEKGIADDIFSLQDAYNALLSDSIDDWDAFADAYMLITGMTADEDDIKTMKEHRVLLLDTDASASYLTKDSNQSEIENLLATVEDKIRELAACPNFASEEFSTSSGIAIRFRCLGMENKTAAQLNNFKKSLQRRLELLASVLTKLDEEVIWRDTEIKFNRNIPEDLSQVYNQINSLRGLVSDYTLLSQIPFIKDVDEEMKLLEEQEQKKMEMMEAEFEIQNKNDISSDDDNKKESED